MFHPWIVWSAPVSLLRRFVPGGLGICTDIKLKWWEVEFSVLTYAESWISAGFTYWIEIACKMKNIWIFAAGLGDSLTLKYANFAITFSESKYPMMFVVRHCLELKSHNPLEGSRKSFGGTESLPEQSEPRYPSEHEQVAKAKTQIWLYQSVRRLWMLLRGFIGIVTIHTHSISGTITRTQKCWNKFKDWQSIGVRWLVNVEHFVSCGLCQTRPFQCG